VYNGAATLERTIRSVLAQPGRVEYIVMDGGSTDGTVDILRKYDHAIDLWCSAPDKGIYDAMNKGIALATGDLIGFLNSDDVLDHPGSVTSMVAAVSAHDSDAVYGDLVYVRANRTDEVVRRWRSGMYSRSQLRYGWMPPHPTFYVRSHVMREVGGFDQHLRIAADYDFVLRCLAHHDRRVAYLPEVLVRMRLGGASNRSVKAMWRKSREDLEALRRSGIGGLGTLLCKNLRKLPQFLT
jgi:glycosyltransferase